MTSIQDTIGQYEQSCDALQQRIAQLNNKIYGRAPFSERETLKSLEERRRLLYAEVTEMEIAIARMREYIGPPENITASRSAG